VSIAFLCRGVLNQAMPLHDIATWGMAIGGFGVLLSFAGYLGSFGERRRLRQLALKTLAQTPLPSPSETESPTEQQSVESDRIYA
jgi:hypothetical protein